MIEQFQKLLANRKRLFTFFGAYKGDNQLLTVHDYNDLVDQLNYNAGKKEAVFILKRFTGIEPPPGVYGRLVSTGGGCLVGGSGCVAGTVTLDKYKAAGGARIERASAGVYNVILKPEGFGKYEHVTLNIDALSRVGFVKVETNRLANGTIIGFTFTCYNESAEVDDLPLRDARMTVTYYAKFLS